MTDCAENHDMPSMSLADPCVAKATLRDGRPIEFRRIAPEDAEQLQQFHTRLSRETTRLRFFSPMPRLNTRMATHFVEVDFEVRCAIVAYFPGELEKIRAVGRYERDGKHSAEVAFVVEDELQGQGIGRVLMKLLAEHARSRGIDRLTAMTLAENGGMLTVFRNCGFPTDITYDGETAHVKIDIRDHTAPKRAPKSLVPSMLKKT